MHIGLVPEPVVIDALHTKAGALTATEQLLPSTWFIFTSIEAHAWLKAILMEKRGGKRRCRAVSSSIFFSALVLWTFFTEPLFYSSSRRQSPSTISVHYSL
jgi:hypothetical protein